MNSTATDACRYRSNSTLGRETPAESPGEMGTSKPLSKIRPFQAATEEENDDHLRSSSYRSGTAQLGSSHRGVSRSKVRTASSERLTRRLKGIVLSFDGPDARVMLIDEGRRFEYELPVKFLKDARVDQLNQPFQFDEFETHGDDGWTIRYRVKPLAERSFVELIELNEEMERKLRKLADF